jgi:hypothetical protein
MRSGLESAKPRFGAGFPGAQGRAAAPGPSPEKIKAEVGRFFVDLRQTFRLSPAQAAKKLSTRPEIVAALETGDVRKLPPWPETCRIVRSYTGLAGLDPRPVLHLIEVLQTVAARGSEAGRSRLPALLRSGPSGQPAEAHYHDEDQFGRLATLARQLRLRTLLALSVPVAIVVLLTQTVMLEAAVSKLPPSVARFVRGAQNYVIVQLAPVRDGLRWIDVPDPRSRKGDKLQTAAQSD